MHGQHTGAKKYIQVQYIKQYKECNDHADKTRKAQNVKQRAKYKYKKALGIF